MRFSDIQLSDKTLWTQIQQAWKSGDYGAVPTLVGDEQLKNKGVNAATFNALTAKIMEVENLNDPTFDTDKIRIVEELPQTANVGEVFFESPHVYTVGELAIGDVIKISVNGKDVNFRVANQGIPQGSSLYGGDCNGTWVFAEDLLSETQFSAEANTYETSILHEWLNNAFLKTLDSITVQSMMDVKIPYVDDSGTVLYGGNGLTCKAFVLSGYEVGFTQDNTEDNRLPVDGAKLDYFDDTGESSEKRQLKYVTATSSLAATWWLRTPVITHAALVCGVGPYGSYRTDLQFYDLYHVSPAFVLNPSTPIDLETMKLIE